MMCLNPQISWGHNLSYSALDHGIYYNPWYCQIGKFCDLSNMNIDGTIWKVAFRKKLSENCWNWIHGIQFDNRKSPRAIDYTGDSANCVCINYCMHLLSSNQNSIYYNSFFTNRKSWESNTVTRYSISQTRWRRKQRGNLKISKQSWS